MTTKYKVVHWIESCKRKRTLMEKLTKSKEILGLVNISTNANFPVLANVPRRVMKDVNNGELDKMWKAE